MNDFDQHIYDIVKELQDQCVAGHRAPVAVSLHQITARVSEEVKQSLNRFVKDGTMTWYPDLNRIPMFTIKD